MAQNGSKRGHISTFQSRFPGRKKRVSRVAGSPAGFKGASYEDRWVSTQESTRRPLPQCLPPRGSVHTRGKRVSRGPRSTAAPPLPSPDPHHSPPGKEHIPSSAAVSKWSCTHGLKGLIVKHGRNSNSCSSGEPIVEDTPGAETDENT